MQAVVYDVPLCPVGTDTWVLARELHVPDLQLAINVYQAADGSVHYNAATCVNAAWRYGDPSQSGIAAPRGATLLGTLAVPAADCGALHAVAAARDALPDDGSLPLDDADAVAAYHAAMGTVVHLFDAQF